MIRFGFHTPDVVLSSDLPDITVFTDHDFVDVRLSAYGNVLLAGRYYALNGTATVSDISSLVEGFLAGNTNENLCEFRIEAYIGEEEAELTEQSFSVLYCD